MQPKFMTRIRSLMALGLLLALGFPVIGHTQTVPLPRSVEPVFGYLSADNADVALLIRYLGPTTISTTNSGTVQVSSGTLLFKVGAQGAEAADTTMQCGATPGTFDTSNAACDTIGEVVDLINANPNWRAVNIDSLRSDVCSPTTLLTLAATRATLTDGLAINWVTAAKFQATVALTPFRRMSDYLHGRNLDFNPYINTRTSIFLGSATSTYASGTSNIRFISVSIQQSPTGINRFSEVATTGNQGLPAGQVYFTPGGATTVAQTFDFRDIGVHCKSNEKCLVRIDNSAAASVVTLRAFGLFARALPNVPGAR